MVDAADGGKSRCGRKMHPCVCQYEAFQRRKSTDEDGWETAAEKVRKPRAQQADRFGPIHLSPFQGDDVEGKS